MQRIAPLKIVKASAGSGKTFSLTVHYLTLLLSKESSYREILAVTFTNKATAEMKHRIMTVLHGLATGADSDEIEQYRSQLQQVGSWDRITIQEKANRVYRRILHDYSHFSVSTIDGFSQKVIRSFTYELNLDSGYAIEMNTNKVKRDLTVMLNQLLDERPELLEWIITYAEQKISNNENWNYRQQLMGLAGLIFSENFQEFDSFMISSDTNKIFNLLNKEIEDKTNSFLEALSQSLETYKSVYQSLGVDETEMKGKSRNKFVSSSKLNIDVRKISISDIQSKVFDKFSELVDNEDAFTDSNKVVRYEYISGIKPALDAILTLQQHFASYIGYQSVHTNLYFLRLLKEMSDLLSLWRKENSAQLISDAQILLNKLGLDEHADPTFIWEKIGNRYNYFLFDEFQDTSRIQWKNYSPLLLNALSVATGKISEHLVVGDVKQSIYRWRNGDWRILLQQIDQQVSNHFHLSEHNVVDFIENGTLDTNYRSLPNIIKLNNYLFDKIPKLMQAVLNEKVAEGLSDEGLVWWNSLGNNNLLIKAYENSEQLIPISKTDPEKPQGSIEINFLPVTSGRSRNNQVIEESVNDLCTKIGEWISSGKYKPSDIGILVRSNAQAKLIIQELMRFKNEVGLSFEVISGDALSLISNNAINLILETLRSLVFQSDKHVIHHANMAYLYQLSHGKSKFEQSNWLKFKGNNPQDLSEVLPIELIESWSALQKMPLVHLVEKLIELYHLGDEGSIHLPYLLAFKDLVTAFSTLGERGIIQFLEYWDEDGERAVLPSNGKINAIEVTTIHKSKGLAYEVVMIPFSSWKLDGLTNGDFWIEVLESPFSDLGKIPVKYTQSLGRSIFYKQYYEEMLFNYMDALNTFYVATTRAKSHLYITAPQFKDEVDKKTGEILGSEIKNEFISDILIQVLSEPGSVFRLDNNSLNILDDNIKKEEHIKTDITSKIELKNYPQSLALETALEKSTKRNINNILMLEKAAQYGVLAHEIVSLVENEDEILFYVNQFIEEGILGLDEKDSLLGEIKQIWHHPLIHEWLTGDYKVWNESSIILEDGSTQRPDKVFTNDKETIVLDFKFTQGDYINHKTQVGRYMNALKNVGYHNIKGYLYYAKSKELVEVK
ncbi:UvrD-helicase domain-containing protein [Sphingobacterium daejeonense]|uniref:UvrD-helicase domain-containing protein n=1 Tax=Sphingobacterium daejeonense TaxID=371142 RepID=UPI0021A76C48|nr:UvrD-helicase domain-containing protein [Sphingobacterium daejeonense]MCT1530769.1 UvrD-helicase domain-containing protein [Sphingobacterium daejeonense]